MADGLKMKYFVLKPEGDDVHAKASRAAMRRYAQIMEEANPTLAAEVRDWADQLHAEHWARTKNQDGQQT